MSGIKDELKHTVRMFKPQTVNQAISIARLQEATLESVSKGNKVYPKSSYTSSSRQSMGHSKGRLFSTSGSKSFFASASLSSKVWSKASTPSTASSGMVPIKRLTLVEMQSRREKGLCYNWDEVYSFGYHCKMKQLFMLAMNSIDSVVDSILSDDAGESPKNEQYMSGPNTYVFISLNALSGNLSFQTLKLLGKVGNQQVTMLVDSGSTHNFLDVTIAKLQGCTVLPMAPHLVVVAGGGQLQCESLCPNFTWSIQGHQFES